MRPALIIALVLHVTTSAQDLSDHQVQEAIELGRAGKVLIVQVGTFLGTTGGDFNVFIEGPVARIAAAASRAFKLYRPFDAASVTAEMKAPVYRVLVDRAENRSGFSRVQRIVLQAKGAKGMDGVVQPLAEPPRGVVTDATFDHFPEGDFDVVVVTSNGPQKYSVDKDDRAKIQ